MKCLTEYKHNVRWTLTNDFLKKIKKSIRESKTEIAGKIFFEDHNCTSRNKCNKLLKEYERIH